MNILQICNKSPYPPKEGGPIAMYNLAEGLMMAGHTVDILAVSTNKYFINLQELPEEYREKTSFSSVFINTGLKFSDALLNLFSKQSYHVQRFDTKDMHNKLIETLQKKKFDMVLLESVYMGSYIETIRKYSKATIILRAHNIEHLIWQRIASTEKNPFKKFYISYLAKKLRRYEENIFAKADGIACISEIDREIIKSDGISVPSITVPFGMKVPENINKHVYSGMLTFFHIGSMDWIPNQEGIRWFLDQCMPLMEKEFPENKILLAGRNMPPWLNQYKFSNLKVIGEVENATEFINSNDIMFVPLLSGSGVRIKILEGMSRGKVVISTRIGAEGINYTDGDNILIADTPQQFVDKFRYCSENPGHCERIGKNAMKLIREYHNIENTTQILTGLYELSLKSKI